MRVFNVLLSKHNSLFEIAGKKKQAKTDSRNFILNKANILARTRVKFQGIAYSAIHLSKENGSHEKS